MFDKFLAYLNTQKLEEAQHNPILEVNDSKLKVDDKNGLSNLLFVMDLIKGVLGSTAT